MRLQRFSGDQSRKIKVTSAGSFSYREKSVIGQKWILIRNAQCERLVQRPLDKTKMILPIKHVAIYDVGRRA